MKKQLLIFLTSLLPLAVGAQEDSVRFVMPGDGMHFDVGPSVQPLQDPMSSFAMPQISPDFQMLTPTVPHIAPHALPDMTNIMPQMPAFADFYDYRNSVSGLLNMQAAGMGRTFQSGRFSLTGDVGMSRVGSAFGGSITQFSTGGSASYQVNDWLRVGFYGQYVPKTNNGMVPLYYPMMQNSRYGGFADIRFSRHWGVIVRKGKELNPMNGKWQDTWSAEPYYVK